MKIVVAGYYGCGNIGDDALLMGLLRGLEGRHEVTALSGDPNATAAAFGIAAVPRRDLRQATGAIREADALVFGGGGLLQDTTSLLSLKYYTHLIETASRAGKLIALLGQGIGPIRNVLGKRAAARAFAQCDLITTRDEGSMRLVERLAPRTKAKKAVTDDLAWLAIAGVERVEPRQAVAISARPWKDRTERVVSAYKGFCRRAVDDGWEIVPVSFDRGMDDEVLNRISPGAKFASGPVEALASLSGVRATVAMRLHAGIFSAGAGVVPTMVAYDAKVAAFAESFGAMALPLENLTEESLWAAFKGSLSDEQKLAAAARERAEVGARRARIAITMLEEAAALRTS